jgi:hypothetical protein
MCQRLGPKAPLGLGIMGAVLQIPTPRHAATALWRVRLAETSGVMSLNKAGVFISISWSAVRFVTLGLTSP